jgi:glycosyltransferase involved in cell wall biosynthesis
MPRRPLDILQISTGDVLGGAERIAYNLHRAYRRRGHRPQMAVGRKAGDDPDVFRIPHNVTANPWRRAWWSAHYGMQRLYGRVRGAWYVSRLLQKIAEPASVLHWLAGIEDFNFPGTWRILQMCRRPPQVVHAHNLHGRYFDLRYLAPLSRRLPVIVSLHDAWLLSGHCAHSFDCDRWKTGCGRCPDLSIYPALIRDGTAYNLRRKSRIYRQSRLHVSVPCRWLRERVEQSVLASGAKEIRTIPNGVDLETFRPTDMGEARRSVGLPADAHVLLFSAFGVRANIWKDYETMRQAAARVASRVGDKPLVFVALGEKGPPERFGRAEIRFVRFVRDEKAVAAYYQASDLYVHGARIDTFPNAVLEALACGTPVVASAVGGIPEQVVSLDATQDAPLNKNEATGVLVPPQDADAMAAAIERLLTNDPLRARLGQNAAADARARFDLNRQVDDFLCWYAELVDRA